MPPTLGTSLKPFVQAKQSAIAQRWLELWENKTGAEPDWKLDTIVGHLSRCLNDKLHGTPFFADLERLEVLLDAIEVPVEARGDLRKLAEASTREPAPRLVIDITTWPEKGEAIDTLFRELRDKVLAESAVAPVALVLTDTQYDRLPRSYDDLPRPPQVHRVRLVEDGVARACELAGDAAIVLAPWQVQPIRFWLAAHFDGRTLKLAPDGWLAAFAAQGPLPDVSTVVHPLADIAAPATTRHDLARLTPVDRHRWIYGLADEAALPALLATRPDLKLPAERLAFAAQLNVNATSLAAERGQHELDQLIAAVTQACGLKVDTIDAATHEQRLARAQHRPAAAAAWRLGDQIHLLNATPPSAHPRLVVHTPNPPQPMISLLLAHIADWTTDDYDTDPSLLHAIAGLMPEGQRRPLLHARATLLWNNLLPPAKAAARVDDWARVLRELLAADPVEASLHLPTAPVFPTRRYDAWQAFLDNNENSLGVIPEDAPWACAFAPARSNLLLSRDESGLVVNVRRSQRWIDVTWSDRKVYGMWSKSTHDGWENVRQELAWGEVPNLWLPVIAAGKDLVDPWLDFSERSSWVGGWAWDGSKRCQALLREHGAGQVTIVDVSKTETRAITVEDATWEEADLVLAQCWMALRAAMVNPLAVRLPNGVVVLSLGGGMSARIELTARRGAYHGESVGLVTAAVEGSVQAGTEDATATIAFASLWTHDAKVGSYEAQLGVRVPARVIIRGPQVRADISFVASPLLQGTPTAQLAPLTAIAASLAADERAAEEMYDDD